MAINIFPRIDSTGANRWGALRAGHWSTRGLLLCDTFGQGSPVSRYPLTRGAAYSGSAAVGASPHGINFSNAIYYVELLPLALSALLPTQRATVLVVRQCADTTLREGTLFGIFDSANTQRLGAHVPYLDGTVYWDFGATSGAGRLSVAFSKTTQVEAWAFIAGANGSSIWRNGVRLATQSTPVTRPNSTGAFLLNQSNGGTITGDVQQVRFFALLDAEWTPTQVRAWTDNPWLMFETRRMAAPGSAAPPAAAARAFATFFG